MQVIPTQAVISFLSQPRMSGQNGLRTSSVKKTGNDNANKHVPTSRALGTQLDIQS